MDDRATRVRSATSRPPSPARQPARLRLGRHAARVRHASSSPAGPGPRPWRPLGWLRDRTASQPRRAIAALLILAAIAGAVGLGVPGIRILFGGPDAAVDRSPAASPPASAGDVGQRWASAPKSRSRSRRLAGLTSSFHRTRRSVRRDAASCSRTGSRSCGARPGLPADPSTGSAADREFQGTVDEGYYSKTLDSDAQDPPVTVDGNRTTGSAGRALHLCRYPPDRRRRPPDRRRYADLVRR